MDQKTFEVEQSLGSEADEQLTRLTRTIWSRWDAQKRAVDVLNDAAHDTCS